MLTALLLAALTYTLKSKSLICCFAKNVGGNKKRGREKKKMREKENEGKKVPLKHKKREWDQNAPERQTVLFCQIPLVSQRYAQGVLWWWSKVLDGNR